ncbi:MAG: hypothetical protein LBJ08_09655 [Bifidobacteriaceae bacterium]|jgi:hypothetical protein|nr:hypothetical protein [Bifidobacteriaceae bacterium]
MANGSDGNVIGKFAKATLRFTGAALRAATTAMESGSDKMSGYVDRHTKPSDPPPSSETKEPGES